jgi:hypothetical protein
VSEITGPISVREGATAYYNIVLTCTKGVTIVWSCEPAEAGTFARPDESITAFTPALVDEETSLVISVTATPEEGESFTRTKSVTIRDTAH